MLLIVLQITTTAFSSTYTQQQKLLIKVKERYAEKIPGAVVKAVRGKISVSGAELVAVYDLIGQPIKNNDLTAGIYIVKIAKDAQVEAVKVVIANEQ